MQLSVIQCNCAVRVLEALAPLAPEYVNDKLVILTVRAPSGNNCIVQTEPGLQMCISEACQQQALVGFSLGTEDEWPPRSRDRPVTSAHALQVRMLNRLAKEHASMAGGIVLRQEPTDQRLNDRRASRPLAIGSTSEPSLGTLITGSRLVV